MIAYKYVSCDRIDVLNNGSIRFTQPNLLNDPFETSPNLEFIKKEIIDAAMNNENIMKNFVEHRRKQVLEGNDVLSDEAYNLFARYSLYKNLDGKILDVLNGIGLHVLILSLSRRNNSALMWSHYADSHKGFVLGFDVNDPFFSSKINGHKLARIRDVVYTQDRPTPIPKVSKEASEFLLERSRIDVLFTKSLEWAYEEEVRVLSDIAECEAIESPGLPTIYLRKFPPESLKSVIIGARMPLGNALAIQGIIKDRYPQASLFRCLPDIAKFSMNVNQIKTDLLIEYQDEASFFRRQQLAEHPEYKKIFGDIPPTFY